ncbi:hypothetical protein ZIOFF_075342 [Zingiber officinale]|uniref:Serine/threonine-protein kinase TOR n=1 Tax=Zingiber officinale TaxID=94328 RepID=A0A8J5C0M8_ZINOF|nr:hypothetical protein ZIOFF_075342 [Zingiber officinale]
MASSAAPIRYGGAASVVGTADALNRILADLCTRGTPKDGATASLKKHVEEAARDLSGETFSRCMDQFYERIANLLESNEVADNLGALRAINELIDVSLGESASKVSRLTAYMRILFEVKRDPEVLILASEVLGHLVKSGGAMTADEVERQIKNAFAWLHGERIEYRRFAAVLILKEMAENASTVFNVHVPEFVDAIWVALRDPTLAIRERAVEALRACLRVIEKRETRWRVQWYYRMCEAAQVGLGKNASVHSIHGSLLAVGELLRNTGEFMMSRYREVADIVLKYLEHRDRLVRLSITSLLPRIAHFLRDRFVTNYLKICMDHILAVLRIPAERASGFIALGEMAGALDGELIPYLPTITLHLRDAIAPRRGRPSLEALACVGSFAQAMGPAMEPHVRSLLDSMFSAGLSTNLVKALEQISLSIPSLLPMVQERLLDSISVALSKPSKPGVTGTRTNTISNIQQLPDATVSVVQLALRTLAQFDFKGHELLEFARESVVLYMEDEDGNTRKEAAICCCRLVANSLSAKSASHFSSSRFNRIGGARRRRLVEEIMDELLTAAVADADVSVRKSVFSSLHEDVSFDVYLCQADSLSSIFVALNDEDFDVRELVISLAGRLSEKNPAYVVPALRRRLIQLLTYLEQSMDSKGKEDSARLLGCLIRSCERLVLPYIAPIHKALVARLGEGTGTNANNGVVTGVLATVGELAKVGGFAMRKYLPELMSLIVDALLDGAVASKREVAVATLGQVVQSTGLFAMESFQNESGQEDIDDYSPLWKFVTKVEKAVGGGNVTWSCNICTKVCKGSYSRVKAHLLKQKGVGIAGCTAVTMDQMKRMQQLVDDAELRKKNSKPKEVSLPSSSTSSNMASKSSFSGPGPLQNDDPTLTKKRKGQLGPLEKAFNLNARDELHSEIARLFYTGGLSFNIARNSHYVRVFSLATQRTIPGYLPPGYNLLRTSLLQKEKAHIEKLLEPTKTAWKQKVNICAPTDSLQNKEAFDECKWIAEVANDASMIKNFILNHNMRLSMFNDNSNLKMLSLANTRFASTIIMLKRFRQIKKCLENMVISERWDVYKEDDVVKARVVKYKILDDQFWEKIDYILAFTSPIYEVLRKVDTDQPCLHLVYEWWDEMIEKMRVAISKGAHSEDSKFYEVVHNILVERWNKSNTPLHCLAHSLNPRYYSHEWLQESPNRLPPHRDIEVSRERKNYVISPYNDHPALLGLLLKMLNGELAWSTRQEVLRVLGIMGALDPHIHKRNQHLLSGTHAEVSRAASETGQLIVSMEELPTEIWPTFVTPDDYYSQVAICSLMRILRDPSLSSYHQKVVGSILYIFKTMGLGCVPYLPKVLPDLFHAIRTCEDGGLKEFITWKLGTLVSIVRQHIRKYLPELLNLISDLWISSFVLPATYRPVLGSPILHLVEQLCLALNDEFRTYLPVILPCCIQVLNDAERCNDFSYVPDILHTLEVFGGTLDEHLHLLLPSLIRLFKVEASVEIRRRAINTMTKLIPRVQVSGYVSSLVHHLILVLDGNNDELRKDAVDALCCLAYSLGEDFSKFIRLIDKLLSKHHMRHKNFEEIKRPFRRREPPIIDSSSAQKFMQQFPQEIVSDHDAEIDRYEEGNETNGQPRNHQINDLRLRTAGEASQRSTKEDWAEWMRHFSIELLKESPMPALRTCAKLAQLQPSVGRELFAAGFASCWAQMNETSQEQLVRNLKTAFSSQNIPPEILATLLNLAEFMEHDEKPLPIDTRLLGALAEKCRAFAKALHYKEMEFEAACSKKMGANPVTVVESLIHINNQLHQHEAAVGILTYSQQYMDVQLKESWYEKLQRWDDALRAYTIKSSQASNPSQNLDATLGRMRCLAALARWEELSALCREQWTAAEPGARLEMAPMAASAAWNMGEWDHMAEYVSKLDDGDDSKLRMLGSTTASGDGSSNGAFFRAVLMVRREKYDEARLYVERARKCLATELAALVLESYERAYSNMVRVQQLSELEEVIDYCTLPVGNPVADGRRELIRNMWNERIQGTKRNVEVWQAVLTVRELVLPPSEDIETWIRFASLCRQSGRISQARSTLIKLLKYDPDCSPGNWLLHGHPQVILAYLKYQWSLGDDLKRKEAFSNLQDLTLQLASTNAHSMTPIVSGNAPNSSIPLLARAYLKLGTWKRALSPGLDDDSIQEILVSLKNATHYAKDWAKAWHTWALFNTAVMSHYTLRGRPDVAAKYVVAAVTGYFYSIACASTAKGVDDSLQDILRLLTLWFNHGATSDVQMALQKGFLHVKIEMWLAVLPQIIARIHSNNKAVRELIQSLLVRIGKVHPQALMYPLLVACKSVSTLRRRAAEDVVEKIRQHHGILVDQAQLVSQELIRVAILWHEMWHEALEEASRLYFGEKNTEGMLAALEPLHAKLEEGPETFIENAFVQTYGRELQEARDCCLKYRSTGKDAELTQSVSPELLKCHDLELAVPGTYRADEAVVTIANFAPQLIVITSKQRPRKLTIHGSDGEDYAFLLKGHEDLRQDERVMQLFGLVNTLLENSRKTGEKDLFIQRYAVIPLSPNSGLIGWVPHCDTLHHLIREYRDARKIPINQEHRVMLAFAPDYDHYPLIAKVEAFEHALQSMEGNDLAKVLWLKSRTSEIWLDRRTNYTRSLAVMSMVGYLLGLGDRHPSNLMLHRYSGKILHIDFGDCFEASMSREKFPEKVPFRLTRMLEKAMGVSRIEGNFRSTCENVMQVLRTNKDSVMAMMEAFVHDPLINWRLFNFNEVPQVSTYVNVQPVVNGDESTLNRELSQPLRGARERELLQAVHQLGDANEVLNERAVVVMAKMSNKLTGRDFSSGSLVSGAGNSTQHAPDSGNLVSRDAREVDHGLSVKYQVDKLIRQATSHENLCQNYVGWCPFW